MSRRILKKLLSTDRPVKRFCTVDRPLPRGRYLVTEIQTGRTFIAESTDQYDAGQQVAVIDKRIVDAARRHAAGKTIRV